MRESIGLGDDYKFGVEIEFDGPSIEEVADEFNKHGDLVSLVYNHKGNGFVFDKSCLDLDGSVSMRRGLKICGGELSTRIFCDKKDDWEELSFLCKILNDLAAYASKYCSLHVNVDISKYKNNPKFFEILYKLLLVYENEIILFLMGEEFLLRETMMDYACPMRLRLLQGMEFIKFDKVSDIIFESDCFNHRDGINAYKLRSGILEFRYPNGTVNPEVIQNNVNFILKIIDGIMSDKFDIKYLDYLIELLRDDPKFIYNFIRLVGNDDSFAELNSIISTSSSDSEGFNKQYKKVIDTRTK